MIASTGEVPGTNRLEISGTMGKLVYESGQLIFYRNVISEREFNKTNKTPIAMPENWRCEIPLKPDNDIHAAVLCNFAAVILRGEELICPGEEGILELTLSNAMYMSAWTNSTISLPLDKEKYLEMLVEKGGIIV